jgi:hypothetical protein
MHVMRTKSLVAAAVFGLILLGAQSCGTVRRGAKDLLITVTSPVVILYGAGTDGAIDSKNIQTGMEASDGLAVVAFPFAFAWRLIDHTFCCALHVLDFCATPFYALAELHPDTDIQPLMIYRGWIDAKPEGAAGNPEPATATK